MPGFEAPFRLGCSVVRTIVFWVQMAFDELVRSVGHSLVDSGGPLRLTKGPEPRCSLRKTAVEAMILTFV